MQHNIATPKPTATMLSPRFLTTLPPLEPLRDASAHSALCQRNTRNRTARARARRPALGTSRRHAETIHGLVYVHRRSALPRRLFHSHHHSRHFSLQATLKPLPPCSTRRARCRLLRATIPSSSTIVVCPTHRTIPSLTRIVSRPYFHELARSQTSADPPVSPSMQAHVLCMQLDRQRTQGEGQSTSVVSTSQCACHLHHYPRSRSLFFLAGPATCCPSASPGYDRRRSTPTRPTHRLRTLGARRAALDAVST
ncbi:hypothetical protein DFH08DRAFT_841518 [Mycena albidolilacea]|uniref:Uncharacterized protein n=1 Tax=Mycena albidolilacea TaxID=1033008 RepID=A0AAD7AMG6_9AGAR|nr:hypothetical protein DFH08DRAFT_841518 [Mycena albidolilacea]